VMAVEMQGHGRTADTDRPMTLATMGDDIAALRGVFAVPKADLVSYSFGGASAIRTAIQLPDFGPTAPSSLGRWSSTRTTTPLLRPRP
jgi:pimeloyl-ACP methyl ester carboxylesterase